MAMVAADNMERVGWDCLVVVELVELTASRERAREEIKERESATTSRKTSDGQGNKLWGEELFELEYEHSPFI
jgi:hypothetical protein